MKKSIAVIGQGFVGGSLTTVFSERGFDVYAYDKAGKYAKGSLPSHGDPVAGYPGSIAAWYRRNRRPPADRFFGGSWVPGRVRARPHSSARRVGLARRWRCKLALRWRGSRPPWFRAGW